ncbi:MAG: formate dehydrogenase accessory sulfurtransferase FdhD [Candidatus Bathyarchaeota archaeon]|nr:formate dehydrogenase accessory sulfurtransferase FdhD [Candidatus Bathyarchaeota archaeon]
MENRKRERTAQPLTTKHEIMRVNLRKDSAEKMKDEVIVEGRTELYINNEHYAVFLFSPFDVKELAIGHLLSGGIIESLSEIKSIDISKGRINVLLTKEVSFGPSRTPKLIRTECGSGARSIPPRLWMKIKGPRDAVSVRFDPQTVIEAVGTLNSSADVFRRTGGTHAAALFDESGNALAFSEDIGRHNAIDKVIGKAALKGVDFRRILLASTGRLTSEMVIKAAHVGIPIIVSISAPTDKGIKTAEMMGMTLIGFVRGKRFNIYTHRERVLK